MKKLLLIFAICASFPALSSDVVISPQCPPSTGSVVAGGGLYTDPCAPVVVDNSRRDAIRAYWSKYSIYPAMVFDAMQAFGVDADELEDAIDYNVNIYHWMRFNQAPDGLGGLKAWSAADIDQYLNWVGTALTDRWARVYAQDVLDLAARRVALYESRGLTPPEGLEFWKYPHPAPVPPQPVQPCVDGVCVVTGP